jgi:hypothetical protein
MDENELLDEQLAYYRARAGEYDERRLGTLGWAGWIRASGKHFLYGAVAPVA